ncbi:hypothetical protein BDF20DRAFT_917168 [Mycotypha africana]|uniref:uncharacterized protein n=1 Tax=Mycotypha africana TaxID=64632 RepID=UPI00230067B4|nr:uncharacterized protein BDF20DRAFT_917168 [Mycotypha africana]KAI8967918.1 hypothetical protein BDF20DRAFT_917168 [Mycotypha africana]
MTPEQQHLSLTVPDNLCYSEQVQLNDDLRLKLMEYLAECCNTSFCQQQHSLSINSSDHSNNLSQQQQHSKLRHKHRHSIFIADNLKKFNIHSFETAAEKENCSKSGAWVNCYLLARDKLVVECRNEASSQQIDTSEPFLYFIKVLANNFLQEKQEYGHTNRHNLNHTTPQNIARSSSLSTIQQNATFFSNTTTADYSKNNSNSTINTSAITDSGSSLSIKSRNSSFNTLNNASQPSSLTYMYAGSNSSNAPFKIKEKSASSVTVIAPESSSIPYWSNPFASSVSSSNYSNYTHQHHIPSLNRTPSNVTTIPQDQHIQQLLISDLLNIDNNFNNHYHPQYNTISSSSYLSSSLPSDTTITSSLNSTNTVTTTTQLNDNMSVLSTLSPIQRSRSHSLTTATSNATNTSTNNNEDLSLRYLLTNLVNNEISYSDQIEDVRLLKRWVKLIDNGTNSSRLFYANILLIILSEGLSSVIIFGDNPQQAQMLNKGFLSPSDSVNTTKASWKPLPVQVKMFKKNFRSYLKDFEAFLLTKESTHFTILSFAINYPGLIHFVHFDYEKGLMTAPLLIDLNDLDKSHELLHQIYEKYRYTDRQWIWPSEPRLKKLVMLLHIKK